MLTPKLNGNADEASGERQQLDARDFEALREFDTCTVANAIERCGVRLRNEGFTRPGLHYFGTGSPRLLGYAATCRIRSSDPPMMRVSYLDRTDWWAAIERLPAPRVAVIQDLEPHALGSSVGEVHAAILKAFHCDGVITNGAVRDIPGVSRMQFPMFACHAAVSHSYAHVIDFGTEVEVFGMPVRSGDLILADCHGAITIPRAIAAEIPRVAAEIRARDQRIIDLCQSPDFSAQKLFDTIKSTT